MSRTDAFQLETDGWGRLNLIDAEGRRHEGVELVRAFPLTDPEHWLVIVGGDGRELVCIQDPAALPAEPRRLLIETLALRELVPIVLRVRHVSSDGSPSDWDVITDRGPTRFTLQGDDDLRRLEGDGLLIRDAKGMRYRIPCVAKLDRASRRWLERHF